MRRGFRFDSPRKKNARRERAKRTRNVEEGNEGPM